MPIKIALAGNPNSGKTTLFNALTGSSQYVGNWPGVTVEKKSGRLKKQKDVEIIDLPGIYSLSPYTLEEVIARDYLLTEKPDVILNIVDASNLERNLYLSTQLTEIGIPVVIALNMIDVVKKSGRSIHLKNLEKALGCTVVETSARDGVGCKEAAQTAIEAAKAGKQEAVHRFSSTVEQALDAIAVCIPQSSPMRQNPRWYSVKLFERDEKVREKAALPQDILTKIEGIVSGCETALDDDCESIITGERYDYIGQCMKGQEKSRSHGALSVSDKIDRIVTNRFLALPIFGLVMFLVYYISVSTIGDMATGWVNEKLFGEYVPGAMDSLLTSLGTADWLTSLIQDGIVAGVGAVLGFLPQMLVLFFCLAILEDCGYMARIAFIMDRVFRKFGLSGKSFIPMLIGTGCGVPAIMASRTIEQERDRKMTVITTTFIPCGAKLPVIALIAGAMFGNSGWVAASAYFIGVASVIISGIMLKKTNGFRGDPAPFVMELPPYHLPGAKGILIHMWDRGKSFVKKAGTIILLSSVLLWLLGAFNWRFEMVEDSNASMLASLGNLIAPLFSPLGWGDWQSAVATISGLIAKENVLATFGILFNTVVESENGEELFELLGNAMAPLAGYSFLVFNLLCAPCFAAIGAIHREMGNAKWTLFAVGYQTVFAYVISMIVFQFGTLLTGGFGLGSVVAIILCAAMLFMLFRPDPAKKGLAKKRA